MYLYIGSFPRFSYTIEIHGNNALYKKSKYLSPWKVLEKEVFEVSDKKIESFIAALQKIEVHKWEKNYTDNLLRDGS